MEIGEKIRKERIDIGLTQQELGDRLGVSQAMIGQYENGTRKPKLETLAKIADALKIPLNYLLTDQEITVEILKADGTTDVIGSGWGAVRKAEKEMSEKIEYFISNAPTGRYKKLLIHFNKLNLSGQNEAIKQVELLTKIPEYRKDN